MKSIIKKLNDFLSIKEDGILDYPVSLENIKKLILTSNIVSYAMNGNYSFYPNKNLHVYVHGNSNANLFVDIDVSISSSNHCFKVYGKDAVEIIEAVNIQRNRIIENEYRK